jgi:hypothetical protein
MEGDWQFIVKIIVLVIELSWRHALQVDLLCSSKKAAWRVIGNL